VLGGTTGEGLWVERYPALFGVVLSYSIYDGPTSFGTPMGPFEEPRREAPVGPFRRQDDTPDDASSGQSDDHPGGHQGGTHGPGFGLLAVDPDSFGRGYRRLRLRQAAMATGAFAMMSLGVSVQPPTTEMPRKPAGTEHTSEMRKPAKKSDGGSDSAEDRATAARVEATGGVAKDASEPAEPATERPAQTAAAALSASEPPPTEPPPPKPAPWQAVPLAEFGGVEVFEISERIQLIGFHEAAYNVALPMTPTDPPAANHGRGPVHFHSRGFERVAPVIVLPTRLRESNPASAMDIAVKAGEPISAPISGVVTAVLPYSLYNKYPDHRIEIAPAGHPELQVTVLHVTGPRVAVGDTIVAGQTPFAQQATLFPFESQIDRFSKATTGGIHPHVHLEFKYR